MARIWNVLIMPRIWSPLPKPRIWNTLIILESMAWDPTADHDHAQIWSSLIRSKIWSPVIKLWPEVRWSGLKSGVQWSSYDPRSADQVWNLESSDQAMTRGPLIRSEIWSPVIKLWPEVRWSGLKSGVQWSSYDPRSADQVWNLESSDQAMSRGPLIRLSLECWPPDEARSHLQLLSASPQLPVLPAAPPAPPGGHGWRLPAVCGQDCGTCSGIRDPVESEWNSRITSNWFRTENRLSGSSLWVESRQIHILVWSKHMKGKKERYLLWPQNVAFFFTSHVER